MKISNARLYFFIMLILAMQTQSALAAFPPPITKPHSMVVSADRYATQAGVAVLKQGGNAIDAAVAVGYALAVTHPCCGNIGGGGFMLLHLHNGQSHFLDFRETAPSAIRARQFLKKNGQVKTNLFHDHALMWGVPGTVRGLNTALRIYGTMPLKRVIAPAIILAQKGYHLTSEELRLLDHLYRDTDKSTDVKQLLYHDGKNYRVGDTFRQPLLAKTLQMIAAKGDAGFYSGHTAEAIVDASQRLGGVITKRDLQHYRAKWRTPVSCNYHGYQIISTPPPGSGVTLCQMLKILAPYPLEKWGFLSARSVHYNVEAMRYAFADRNQYLGDPDYQTLPVTWLLSAKHIAVLQKRIKPQFAGKNSDIKNLLSHEASETTHYSIIDKWGNAVAVTYSLNGYFGSHVMPDNTGFFMNNTIDDFTLKSGSANNFGLIQGKQNLVAPHHRPLSSMSPTIILKNNKVRFILGTPGGSTILTQLLLAIENLIDYKMNIAQAIDQCRYHMQGIPDKISVEPFCFSPDTLRLLRKMGYQLNEKSTYFGESYWGGMAGIAVSPKTGWRRGAMDIRRPGGAALGF